MAEANRGGGAGAGGAMSVRSTRVGDAVVIAPIGDIDLSGSPVLRQELRKLAAAGGEKPGRVVIDLSGVSYMDSSGVATLVEAMQMTRKANTKLLLCGMQDRVKSIFEIARLDTVFTIVRGVEEAMEGGQEPGAGGRG